MLGAWRWGGAWGVRPRTTGTFVWVTDMLTVVTVSQVCTCAHKRQLFNELCAVSHVSAAAQ